MKKASISETKNNLSAILRQVREGETFLIVDHGKPVARIEPLAKAGQSADLRRADLERRGILRRGRGQVRREILQTPPPALPRKVSALALLLEERESGR
jgi:prevent-host-death family protein